MIYIDTGTTDACENFGAEYYFAAEKILDDEVLLLWRTTPTLMLGKYQNVFEEVDLDYAREKNISLVRRMSGGGTIYTDEGAVQYTFIGAGNEEIEFERYMLPVIDVLRGLGIPAERDGRNDIVACGRKVSGNAQFKLAGRTVHHGSLLFSTDLDEMDRATRLPEYKITSKSIKSVRERVRNMSTLTDAVKTSEEFAAVLREKLSDSVYVLTDEDRRRISELADEKFRVDVMGNTSAFDFEKVCAFEAGRVIVGLKVKRGIVTEASVRGDFFAAGGTDSLTDALTGVKFDKKAIYDAVVSSDFSAYGINAASLAEELTKGL